MKLCIIPARGGSKRIPHKNIKPFFGRPMIGWSIAAARESGCFDRIIVSTDDPEIAKVAQELGAEVPFLRPSNLSDDFTGTGPVTGHAMAHMQSSGVDVTAVCCLYATAPFVRSSDINAGLSLLQNNSCDFVFSVTTYAFPPARALRIHADNRVEMINPAHELTRSQDLEEVVHDAGQFYWGTPKAWSEDRSVYGKNSIALPLPRHLVQDIDTPEDWNRAEWMMRAMQAKNSQDPVTFTHTDSP